MELFIDEKWLEEALRRVQAGVDAYGSQVAFARACNLSHTIVSQVIKRRIDPPPQLLAAIGLRRRVIYEEIPPSVTLRRRRIAQNCCQAG